MAPSTAAPAFGFGSAAPSGFAPAAPGGFGANASFGAAPPAAAPAAGGGGGFAIGKFSPLIMFEKLCAQERVFIANNVILTGASSPMLALLFP